MKFVIHGNCQAGAIAFLMRDLSSSWNITALQVHNCNTDESTMQSYKTAIAAADVILYQPVSEGYRGVDFLSAGFVQMHAQRSAVRVCYPSIYYGGFMQGYAPLRDAKGQVLSYRDTDALLPIAAGILEGHEDSQIMADLLNPDLISQGAIEAYHAVCIAELARREEAAHVEVPVSEYINMTRYERKSFHTYNHPYRHLLAYMMNCIFRKLSLPVTVKEDGPDPLGFLKVPSLPAITCTFKETPVESKFQYYQEISSREDYFLNSIRTFRQKPLTRLSEIFGPHAEEWKKMSTRSQIRK